MENADNTTRHLLEEEESYSAAPPDNIRGCFYSVFAPSEIRPKGFEVCKYIFSDKIAALKFVRETKKARFRQFEYYQDAVDFATHGLIEQPKRANNRNGTVIKTSPTGNEGSTTCHGVGEKMSPFKGPKPQDLVKLRKAIECGQYELVRDTIWENPRYLVSSGDTPSILQEGYRYNALHVAAKLNRSAIADLILTTISDEKFIKLLYGDDGFENVDGRIRALLDLYLNTPDKGINETPLHFAVKFGAAEVVEVLVSFPQCDKTLKNKHQQSPDMIICDRYTGPDPPSPIRKKISMLLKNEFYVPVLRAEDNSTIPVIGEPFSPGRSQVVSNNPLSPRMEIHAYAGPMNREGAEQFRRLWKTPPRTSTPAKSRNTNASDDLFSDSLVSLRYTDHSKGLERLGQTLATKFDIIWQEFWPFLDCFVDITSAEGLDLLEAHLGKRAGVLDRSCGLFDSIDESTGATNDKGGNLSTISDLCRVFRNCNLIDSLDDERTDGDSSFSPFLCVEKACIVFANRLASDIANKVPRDFESAALSIEHQVRQLELLMASYGDDARFRKVDFRRFHWRLAELVARRILSEENRANDERLAHNFEEFLFDFVKSFDFFSSDEDERGANSNPTAVKKQAVCVMRAILEKFDSGTESDVAPELQEEDCAKVWAATATCSCVFNLTKGRKTGGKSRNSKCRSAFGGKDSSVRRLFSNDNDVSDRHLGAILSSEKSDSSSCSEDDEDFYTPPVSPTEFMDCEGDDDEDYSETQLLPELFIEGEAPSKTDTAVFNALKFSNSRVDPGEYPNIYRWLHNVNLYPETERSRWPDVQAFSKSVSIGRKSLKNRKSPVSASPPSTPIKLEKHSPKECTPTSRSWLRIIGVNSPKR